MNTSFIDAYIEKFSLHRVGNKIADEGFILSDKTIELGGELLQLMTHFFVSGFKSQEFYHLYHDVDLKYNEIYGVISEIFTKPENLHKQSINLAKHLYEQSTHPKIKGGEFYVVYFKDCIINGETVDAVGLFKSENKDTFLKVYPSGDGFEIESQQGVNINKLDKGCLIFNTDRENGYVVAVVDNTNKGAEAHYWIDDFLHVRQRKDEYYNTQNAMSFAKDFVVKELPKEFVDISKADQADLLNKSVQFFKEKDTFDIDEFANEVIAQPEIIDSFNKYKKNYQQEREIEIADNFTISDTAVKKQARVLKSVIKLDKNFHIYVHGNNQYIRKGYDAETGLHYYQLFFKEEQ